MKLISKKNVFVLLVLAGISLPVYLYSSKLSALLHHPDRVLQLVSDASGVSGFSLKFLLINVSLFLFAALIDLVAMGWEQSALRRLFRLHTASARGDLWCWVLSVFNLYDVPVLLLSFGVFYAINSLLLSLGGLHLLAFVPHPVLQFMVVFCLGDLKQYLWHRFMHLGPMWELHQYHHSATEFNLITSARGHFLEKGILTLFDGLLFALLGAPESYFIGFILAKEFYNYLLHSNLNWDLGWIGKYLLVSPLAHKLHHGEQPQYFNKNYGTFFIFWDKLFRTYARANGPVTIGVTNTYYNSGGFWKDMYRGTLHFLGWHKTP